MIKFLFNLLKSIVLIVVGAVLGYNVATLGDDIGWGKAFSQYHLEAERGNAESQYWVSRYILEGKGADRKPQEALKWLQKSAKNGFLKAQTELAWHYEKGILVAKNEEMALQLYKEIAETSIKRLKKETSALF